MVRLRHLKRRIPMANRSASADLPLHSGRIPRWLSLRMSQLGAVICEAIVREYGRDELLQRLRNRSGFSHSAPSWEWTSTLPA